MIKWLAGETGRIRWWIDCLLAGCSERGEYCNHQEIGSEHVRDAQMGIESGNLSCRFFFQAEDGIRDVAVTGVQTCALPISGPNPASVITFRAASSTVPESRPARAASSAASCALRTISKTRTTFSEGLPNKIGRASCRERV